MPSGGDEAARRINGRIEALETALEALQGLVSSQAEIQRVLTADAQDAGEVLGLHESRLGDLTVAVSEGIQNVKRHEQRIRATVRRARQELEDGGTHSPGLDAEAQELRLIDGDGSEPTRVPPVREDVAGFDATGLPGDWRPGDVDLMTG